MKTVTIPSHFIELKASAIKSMVPAVWTFVDEPELLPTPTLIAQSACKKLVARVTYSEAEDTFALVLLKKTRDMWKPWAECQKLDRVSGADIVSFLRSKF